MSEAKTGMFIYPFFWFMNRLISTSQQIKSVVRWFFPILQFNCGRDVSSQYFISTNARLSSFLAAVSFFWKEQRQQEVTNFAFDKRHFCWNWSQLTCNSTTAKANLVSCSFAGWSAALMNREILKKEISEMFFNTLIQIFPDSSSMRQPFHFILMIIGKCSEEEKNGKVWSFAKLVGGVSEGSKKPSL